MSPAVAGRSAKCGRANTASPGRHPGLYAFGRPGRRRVEGEVLVFAATALTGSASPGSEAAAGTQPTCAHGGPVGADAELLCSSVTSRIYQGLNPV